MHKKTLEEFNPSRVFGRGCEVYKDEIHTIIKNYGMLLFVADNVYPAHFCSIYFDSNITYRQVATSATHSRKNFLLGTIVSFNQFWFTFHTVIKNGMYV